MINLLRTRRSIRNYQNKKIEPEPVEILQEALLRAPTSRDNQAWEFIFVDDKNLPEKKETIPKKQLRYEKIHFNAFGQ